MGWRAWVFLLRHIALRAGHYRHCPERETGLRVVVRQGSGGARLSSGLPDHRSMSREQPAAFLIPPAPSGQWGPHAPGVLSELEGGLHSGHLPVLDCGLSGSAQLAHGAGDFSAIGVVMHDPQHFWLLPTQALPRVFVDTTHSLCVYIPVARNTPRAAGPSGRLGATRADADSLRRLL